MKNIIDHTCYRAGFTECRALNITQCSVACPFYMKASTAIRSRNTANRRLRSLPEHQQKHISLKYHNGKRPWLSANIRI